MVSSLGPRNCSITSGNPESGTVHVTIAVLTAFTHFATSCRSIFFARSSEGVVSIIGWRFISSQRLSGTVLPIQPREVPDAEPLAEVVARLINVIGRIGHLEMLGAPRSLPRSR